MPPRIRPRWLQSLPSSTSASRLQCGHHGHQRAQRYSTTPIRSAKISGHEKHKPNAERGAERARQRAEMDRFLYEGVGSKLRQPLKGSTNYLSAYTRNGELARMARARRQKNQKGGNAKAGIELPPETEEDRRPFPLNKHFHSQPVLSEELRTEVWKAVKERGEAIKAVSSSFGVSIERVAAVVRMKEMERNWMGEGKPLAAPYSRAVLEMVPTTPLVRDIRERPVHESINDIYVHPTTKAQLFYPVSESRQFSREDAGHAFDNSLLATEKRIPHPEMVTGHRWLLDGRPQEEVAERMRGLLERDARRRRQKEERRREQEAREVTVVPAGRWDFKFRAFNAADVGRDGRAPRAVGFRYGAPHEDRKKGQVKIPTRVLG